MEIKIDRLILREMTFEDYDSLYAVRDWVFTNTPFIEIYSFMK